MVDFLVFTRKFCRCQVRRSRWLCHKNCFGAGYCVMYISRLELFTTFFYLTISLEVNFLLMFDLFRIYPKSGWLNKKMAKKPQSRWIDFFCITFYTLFDKISDRLQSSQILQTAGSYSARKSRSRFWTLPMSRPTQIQFITGMNGMTSDRRC